MPFSINPLLLQQITGVTKHVFESNHIPYGELLVYDRDNLQFGDFFFEMDQRIEANL